jgi:type IV secretion system protein TrbI
MAADKKDAKKLRPKTDRKLLTVCAIGGMIAFVIFIFIIKGPDLGQSQVNKKAEQAAQEKKAEEYKDKIDDPSAASQEAYDAAKAKVDKEKAQQTPPPMHGAPPPPTETDALAPPPPSNMSGSDLGDNRLDKANRVVNDPSLSGSAPSTTPSASFVAYTAGGSSTSSGNILSALDVSKNKQSSGTQGSSSSGGNPNAASDQSSYNPKDDPDVKASQARADAYEAAMEANAQKNATPGSETNEQWLYKQENDAVKASKTIVATHSTGLYWIAPGTIINAIIVNAVDTSLPGHVSARVSQTIYDSRYSRYEVIPAGSILMGEYNSTVKDGQKRVMFAFDTLVTPSGGEVALGNMSAGDALGQAGVAGTLHTHFLQRLGIATLFAVEAVGMDRLANQTEVVAGTGQTTTPPSSSGGQIMIDAANEELKERSALGPNITIPAGAEMTITTTGGIEVPPLANAR